MKKKGNKTKKVKIRDLKPKKAAGVKGGGGAGGGVVNRAEGS